MPKRGSPGVAWCDGSPDLSFTLQPQHLPHDQIVVEERRHPFEDSGSVEVGARRSQTASAASSVQPPTKTARRRKSACSAGASRS